MILQIANYDIHGLITIHVKGNRQLIKNIDLHLWAFKVISRSKYTSIVILPYSEYFQEKNGLVTDDWVFSKGFATRSAIKFAIGFKKDTLFMYTDSLELPINLLIQIMLLRSKCSFIHAAGFKTQNLNGIIVAAGPGAGKTTLTAVADKAGWVTLGDDLCIVGKGKIWSYPQALSIYPYHKKIFKNFSQMISLKLQVLSFFGALSDLIANKKNLFAKFVRVFINILIKKNLNLSPIVVLKNSAILNSVKISKFIFMVRICNSSKIRVKSLKSRDFSDITTILWHEWHSSFHEILLIDTYLYGGKLFSNLFRDTRRVYEKEFGLKKLVETKIPAYLTIEELLGEFHELIKYIDSN